MVKVYLSQKGISFTERNVSEDREARDTLIENGFRTTPVTVIGSEWIAGYSTDKIDEALAAAGAE